MAVISHKHRFVYLPPPKTGSTAIRNVLERKTERSRGQYDAIRVGTAREPSGYLNDVHDPTIPPECGTYLVFVTVRHPYSRLVSLYRDLRQHPFPRRYWAARAARRLTFQSWLVKLCRDSQHIGISPIVASQVAYLQTIHPRWPDRILRNESLQRDFNTLPFLQGRIRLPRLRVSSKQDDWRSFWSRRLERVAYRFCRPELEAFGYCRDSWRTAV